MRTLSGVGAAAERTLLSHGVRTLGAMGRADGALLRKIFGKNGEMMRDRALGRDRSEVAEDDEVKSVSNEVTYAHDLETREDIMGGAFHHFGEGGASPASQWGSRDAPWP